MKAKTLVVTVSKTTQIVQFEPLVVSATETYELDAGEDLKEARSKALGGPDNGNQYRPGETPLPATMQVDWMRVWQYG